MKKLEVNYLDAEMEYFMRDGKANAVVYIDFEGEFEEGVNGNRYYATSYGESIYNYEYNNNEWNIITHNLDLNLY